jgi:hypothetical protein
LHTSFVHDAASAAQDVPAASFVHAVWLVADTHPWHSFSGFGVVFA